MDAPTERNTWEDPDDGDLIDAFIAYLLGFLGDLT